MTSTAFKGGGEGFSIPPPTPLRPTRPGVAGSVFRPFSAVFPDVSFNLVFHTAPHQHDGPFHWHAHLWPKLTTVAGFERGTGVMINIVPPEQAADELRRVGANA